MVDLHTVEEVTDADHTVPEIHVMDTDVVDTE